MGSPRTLISRRLARHRVGAFTNPLESGTPPPQDLPRRFMREVEPEGRTDFSQRRCPPDLCTLLERQGLR